MRFGGIERLYGKTALKKFSQAHVCIVGIGGVGSWAVEALARSGIGKITMIDLDEICITNINRQLHAMDGEIGRQKTAAMASRINAIHPDCDVVCLETFFNRNNADEILDQCFDYVIDAIDRVQSKALLLSGCKKRDLPVISCGGAGGLRDPSQIKVDDIARCHNDSLIGQVRVNLRKKYGFPAGPDPKIKRKLKKFNIDCIFSSERPVYQQCDGEVSEEKPDDLSGAESRINCVSGFGSTTHMTATFGFFAVSKCLAHISNSDSSL